MIRTPARAAAAALLLIVALAGCGTRSTPVAKVGDRTLTVDDFTRAARGNEGNVPGPPELAKTTLLRELVEREMFVLAAHEHGTDTLAVTRQFRDGIERKLLVQALYQSIVPSDVGASEAEARALYEQRRMQSDVHLVYTTDEQILRVAMQRLAAGQPFEQVADQCNEPNALPTGGALGMRQPGDLFQPLDDALVHQRVGVVGGPWHTAQGWFLLKITSRVPAPQPPFEQVRASLLELIRQRKQRQALATGLLGLEASRHLQVTTAGPAMLFRFLAPARSADAPHWMPDAAGRRAPLATFDGGAFTMGEAIDALMNDTGVRGPDASSIGSVRAWIQSQSVARMAVDEARRRHLHEEPAVRHQLEDQLANHLAQAAAMEAVANVAAPGEGAGRQLWETLKLQYPQLQGVHFLWVATSDTGAAGAVARAAAAGASLRDAARAADPPLEVREETLRFPIPVSPWQELQGELSQLGAGATSPPLFTGRDWRIVQMLERRQGSVEWEQLSPPQQEQVTRSVADRARQARFEAYKDSLWKAMHPVLMPEKLKRLPWPLGSTVAVGS